MKALAAKDEEIADLKILNALLMEKISSLKKNSISNLKREEQINHLKEKILRFKNLAFDRVEQQFKQTEGLA